jgi:hypothetical protein
VIPPVRCLPETGTLAPVDLEQLDGRAIHLDEGDQRAAARAVGGDDHPVALECRVDILDLERDMSDGLHQLGIGCVLPVSLPLDAERIVRVIAHRDFQMRKVDLARKRPVRRYADVMEFHGSRLVVRRHAGARRSYRAAKK